MEQEVIAEIKSKQSLTKTFLKVFAVILCIFIGYVCGQTISFRNSEKMICDGFERHLTRIDSIYNAHLSLTANSVSDTLSLRNELLKKLNSDSLALARERNIAIETQKAIVDLHIEKVDNDYTVITIWGAVLSILFIVFSFFSIYKIEDTKKQMEELRDTTDKEAKEQLAAVKKEVETHKKNASTQVKTLKEVVDKYDSGYADFQKKWDETFMNLQSRYQDAIAILNSTTDKLTGKK